MRTRRRRWWIVSALALLAAFGHGGATPPMTAALSWWDRVLLRLYAQRQLAATDELIALGTSDPQRVVKGAWRIEDRSRTGMDWLRNPLALNPFVSALEIGATARADTQLDLARIALAACAHRDTHGDWPTSTEVLAALLGGERLTDLDGTPYDLEVWRGELWVLCPAARQVFVFSMPPWEIPR
jgi:hypothetical protein